jgi:hypothetical protein
VHVVRTDDSETVAWTARGGLGGSRLPRHGSGLAFNPAPIFLDPLNDELADVFRRWYPEFDRRGNEEELAA